MNNLLRLQDDIALALATSNIRILTPIPGKAAVGIEVPNIVRELVTLGDLLANPEWKKTQHPLGVALGKDISGRPFYFRLSEMPHLLVAGATGSGKSVCVNSLIVSMLYIAPPDIVRFLMVDPKRVELTVYNEIPHLVAPVVVNPKQAAAALAWAVTEMERRYEMLTEIPARNIETYNEKAGKNGRERMPYLVVVIDELADLMMVSPKEVEESICRLAQLARAVGIHLVVATQRPSANVITGLIKSNITTRIAFSVSSQIDSRVIIDQPGAEKLIGKGDMLFSTQSLLKPVRLQGPMIGEDEVERVVSYVRSQGRPHYNEDVLAMERASVSDAGFEDELIPSAIDLVLEKGVASTSYLQRRLRIGYARAASIVDALEARGIVGPPEGTKPRRILITKEDWDRLRDVEYPV